jgi:sorbitol-specific phosphotransferase system component IIBC
MNWRNFFIALLIGAVIATGLVLAFQRWPYLAESNWTMLGLFVLALVCSRLMRRFIRK